MNKLTHKLTDVRRIQRGTKTVTEKTVTTISLNDDCRNGRESWSVTADIYEDGREVGGGFCHEHILGLRPELAEFVALHLCDFTGAPMHGMANGFYWFAGWKGGLGEKYHAGSGSYGKTPEKCREIFREHFRATLEEMAVFDTCGAMTAEELQAVGEDLGIPARWRKESEAAIARLEALTGRKFETASTKPGFEPLKPEVRALIAERKASGYYLPETVAERLRVNLEAKKAKALAELEAEHAKDRQKLANNHLAHRWMVEMFGETYDCNLIWYSHTNQVACNWNSSGRNWTEAEFAELEAKADKTKLPVGVKFVWKKKGSR
jgi:hypothetical protein